MGTEPRSTFLLSYDSTTKPLQCYYGLVVLSYDNKSADQGFTVGQATTYLALSDVPRALPPSTESALLANPKFTLESITFVSYLNRGLHRDLNL
jgi:hypothetical protein